MHLCKYFHVREMLLPLMPHYFSLHRQPIHNWDNMAKDEVYKTSTPTGETRNTPNGRPNVPLEMAPWI